MASHVVNTSVTTAGAPGQVGHLPAHSHTVSYPTPGNIYTCGVGGQAVPAEPWPGIEILDVYTRTLTPMGLIAARLQVRPGEMCPFEFINAHRVSPEKVIVFIVQNGEPVVIHDDGMLFPSDGLITQLRLLTKG